MSYDRSDLIQLNESSYLPASHGKGINLLVMHGTADTVIHPQHSMMLVRGVMQQQQQKYAPTSFGSGPAARRNSNSTASGVRVAGGITRSGAIRISQLVMPDVDLSNSRMATGTETGSPASDQRLQLLHSVYSHVAQYLATECFTGVGDGGRGLGVKVRSRRLRKRRRRRWRAGNRDQGNLDDQKKQQQQRGEEHQQRQQNQRNVHDGDNDRSKNGDDNSDVDNDRVTGGRYRRHDIDDSRHAAVESEVKDGVAVMKIDGRHFDDSNGTGFASDFSSHLNNNKTGSSSTSGVRSNDEKEREKYDDDDEEDDEEEDEDDDDENSDDDEEFDDIDDDDDDDDD